jgi:Saxitoxin biosynthesis operon protein SxtJ
MAHARSNERELRRFGWLVGGILAVIGLWPLIFRGEAPRAWLLVPGAVLMLAGVIIPTALAPAYRAWMWLADVLGWINTRVILGVVFYAVFTPVGFVMRLLRHDPLRRSYEPLASTYRVVRSARRGDHMRRQF